MATYKHKGGKKHTGPIRHADMHSHVGLDGLGKDPHASKEYHAANAEHGMGDGLCHEHDRSCGGMGEGESGGEGMGENISYGS